MTAISQIDKKFLVEAETILNSLNDNSIIEIILDANQHLYCEKIGVGFETIGSMLKPAALKFLGTIAHSLGTTITSDRPTLEGEVPVYGSRIAAAISPVTPNPIFVIRKHAKRVFTLTDYVEDQILDTASCTYLENAIFERKNIVIAGGVGSGKTTFANAILDAITKLTPNHRILTLEDTNELQLKCTYGTAMRTCEARSLLDLTRLALRLRPDRIVIGEVRSGEVAQNALKAFHTGSPGGLFTIHANSAEDTVLRIEELLSEITAQPSRKLIARSVDIIVYMSRGEQAGRRKVEQILELKDFDDVANRYVLQPILNCKKQA